MEMDPRPAIQKVVERKMGFDYEAGTTPKWVWAEYEVAFIKATPLFINTIFFSVNDGKATALTTTTWVSKTAHLRHSSKETIFNMYSSFALPKGSPLKVT